MGVFKDLTGQRFNRLVAIKRIESPNNKHGAIWECVCDCGNKVVVASGNLKNGNTKSCGCLLKEGTNKKHGMNHTKIYMVYNEMISRCYNNKNKSYIRYGGRGITICDTWLNKKDGFQNFYNWAMVNGYQEGLTIDRINNNDNYNPDNCRWTTLKKQNNNRNNNVIFTYNNKTQTLEEWAEELGIKSYNLRNRRNRGNSIEKILSPYLLRNPKKN